MAFTLLLAPLFAMVGCTASPVSSDAGTATIVASQDSPADLHASQQLQSINGAEVGPSARPGKGDVVTYAITVTNAGGSLGTANLTRSVPKGATYAGPSAQNWSCPVGSGAGTSCHQSVDVAANSSVQVLFTIQIDGGSGSVSPSSATSLSPSVSPSTTVPAESAAAVLDTVWAISSVNGVPATASTLVGPGDQITYSVAVTNVGNSSGTATLSDVVPVNTTSSGETLGWSCPTASVAGTSCSQQVIVGPHSTSTVKFAITVGASLPPNTTKIVNTGRTDSGTCSQCSVTSTLATADLSVSNQVDARQARAGAKVKITIKVHNHGPDVATDVTLIDVSSAMTLVSNTSTQGTFDPNKGSWTIGSLAKGKTATLTLVEAITSASASNTAMAASPHELDPNVANSTAKVLLGESTGVTSQAGQGPTTTVRAGSASHTNTKANGNLGAGDTSKSGAQEVAFLAVGIWRLIGLALIAVLTALLLAPLVMRRWRISTWR